MVLAVTLISTGLVFASVEAPRAIPAPDEITERTFQCPPDAAVRTARDDSYATFECIGPNEVGHGPFWCRSNRNPRLLTCLGNQTAGELDGSLTFWDMLSGRKEYEGTYAKGRLHGLVKTWHWRGRLTSEEVWENGPPDRRRAYLPDNAARGDRGKLQPDSRARITRWDANGRKRAEIVIEAGKTFSAILFDEAGALVREDVEPLSCAAIPYACEWDEKWVLDPHRRGTHGSARFGNFEATIRPSQILEAVESSLRQHNLQIAFSAHTATAAMLVTSPGAAAPDVQAHYRFSLRLSDCDQTCRVAVSADRVLVPLENGQRVPARSRFEDDPIVASIIDMVQQSLRGAGMNGR